MGMSPGESGEVLVDLPSDLTAAGAARAVARRVLPGWLRSSVLEPVLLVVSELVGNAVRHGRPPVNLRLTGTVKGVRVGVHDEDAQSPATQVLTSSAESGRGMFLVDAVSVETGVEQIEGDGKVVWARVEPEPGSR